jgi:23S rRNA (adenine2030-N6)-methyltransferase
MNYRHAYHAGNFADVFKHAVLARILTYLKLKPQPFRVIDTHAGAGRYDLTGVEAGKTGEWRDGIARVLAANHDAQVASLLAPYLDAVAAVNVDRQLGELTFYPGSPVIARHLMRYDDYLVANECHPEDAELLSAEFRNVHATKILKLDGWQAIKSLLPPKERRGLVLIDPPFEKANEFQILADGLMEGLRRFETGTFVIWYPIKDMAAANRLVAMVHDRPRTKYLDVRLAISDPFPGLGLTHTGLLVINPPFTLRDELKVIGPALAEILAEGTGAGFHLESHD